MGFCYPENRISVFTKDSAKRPVLSRTKDSARLPILSRTKGMNVRTKGMNVSIYPLASGDF